MELLPDLLILDIDGTLLATDSFWVDVLGRALARVGEARGLRLQPPPRERILAVIGQPDAQGYPALLPPALHPLIPEIRRAVEEIELRSFARGEALLYPGAAASLATLHAAGVRLALASNCGLSYLRLVRDLPSLRERIDHAWCAESPGIGAKADMVGRALAAAGTRRAVMVGDRTSDQEAAHAHGIPLVRFTGGFADAGEAPAAEASFPHWDGLPDLLGGRARALAPLSAELSSLPPGAVAALTGPAGAGKSLLAEDLARLLAAAGRPPAVISLDRFLRPEGSFAPPPPGGDHLGTAFDLPALETEIRRAARSGPGPVLVEGVLLDDPRLAPGLALLVEVTAREEVLVRRLRARHGPGAARELGFLAEQLRRRPGAGPPRRLRVETSNPLHPRVARPSCRR